MVQYNIIYKYTKKPHYIRNKFYIWLPEEVKDIENVRRFKKTLITFSIISHISINIFIIYKDLGFNKTINLNCWVL